MNRSALHHHLLLLLLALLAIFTVYTSTELAFKLVPLT